VVLERVNSHVEIAISDSGEGISPEFLPYVFQRFRQADASASRKHGGLGLGLSIVKNLVELHGGSVRVKSAGTGQGATFVVALPLSAAHAAEPPSADRRHPRAESGNGEPALSSKDGNGEPSLRGISVLAVDDEPDARELIRRLLEGCGAEVVTATSAAEAMTQMDRRVPDVLLSDIGMPGEDGYDLIRRIRARPAAAGGTVPAAALTAFARSDDRTRALRAGYQTHIAKPVEAAELIAAVGSLAGIRAQAPADRRPVA
jgi:CheY-like chemotaxis protein